MEFEDWILKQDPTNIPKIRKEVNEIAYTIYHERLDPVSTPERQLKDTQAAQEIVMMDTEEAKRLETLHKGF